MCGETGSIVQGLGCCLYVDDSVRLYCLDASSVESLAHQGRRMIMAVLVKGVLILHIIVLSALDLGSL